MTVKVSNMLQNDCLAFTENEAISIPANLTTLNLNEAVYDFLTFSLLDGIFVHEMQNQVCAVIY